MPLLTPDVVANAGAAAHVLVAEEAHQVQAAALVLAGLAVDARGGSRGLVAVHVEATGGDVLFVLRHLLLAQHRHLDGVGCRVRLEELRVELRSVDLFGHGRPRQRGEEDGGDAGLHGDELLTRGGRKREFRFSRLAGLTKVTIT